MKIFKKVLTAIGHFFRNIWRYIMTNAWIQPILIVALIFAIIFGLTGIPTLIDKVEELFDDSVDNKIKTQKEIDVDEFFELYEGNETFFIVFGKDDCSSCKTLYKDINTYMDDEEHKEIVNAKIYFMNISDLLEDVEDDYEDYDDDFINHKRKTWWLGKELDKSNFEYLEELGNILYNGYEDILSTFNGNDHYSTDEEFKDSGYSYYPIQTPTTVFFTKDTAEGATHSKLFNMVVDQWKYKQGYSDINELFNCWHLSETDWDKATKARDALRVKYTG